MSYTWDYLQHNQKQVKRLLGIDYEQLSQLIAQAKLLDEQHQEKNDKLKVRLIKRGGGAARKLSLESEIVLTLIYLRHHTSFQLLALQFQVSESKAHSTFNYWQSIFRKGLPPSLLEQVKKWETEEEEVDKIREKLTESELIVDSAEQLIERPSDYNEQKSHYSGKKKNHTFKNQFIVLPKGEDIVDVVVGYPGPKSDIKICRERLVKFEKKQKFSGDKAYVGEAQITTPYKKPKQGELTAQQKEENKLLSSDRIFVEHLIRLIKIFKIAQERFRLQKSRYQEVIMTVCGLVRLRKGSLRLEVIKEASSGKTIEIITTHSFGCKLPTLT
ncbi:MAG: transposase [Symploca sp. SIO1A3]|nr:transposase [Symploca sp. SIO1A3]